MSSPAYRDFVGRLSEPRSLLALARSSTSPQLTAALAKGAVVLAAAALERFVNDALEYRCSRMSANLFDALTEGEQRYLIYQMASRILRPAYRIARKGEASPKARRRFRRHIQSCMDGLGDPQTWSGHTRYGRFMDGAAEPSRMDDVLSKFHPSGEGLFTFAERRGRDRGALATGLEALIDARHAAAHALTATPPSQQDARRWVAISFTLAREVEIYLT